jgi:hypothetical protein
LRGFGQISSPEHAAGDLDDDKLLDLLDQIGRPSRGKPVGFLYSSQTAPFRGCLRLA